MTNEHEAALEKAYQRFITTTNSELQQNWSDDFDPEKITKRDLKSAIKVFLDETKLQEKLKIAEEALESIAYRCDPELDAGLMLFYIENIAKKALEKIRGNDA